MPEYLIDQILPASRIHLIGGESNAGKTRFLLPMLLKWQAGEKVLGFDTVPVPWAYVVGDRFLIEAHDTCRDMGIDHKRIPMIPAFGEHNKTWLAVLKEAEAMKLGLLVWEGFTDFCEGERKKDVRDFISSVGAYCCRPEFHDGSLTILGVTESPKQKPFEKYSNPRQLVSGVSSWGYHASSVFLIVNEDPANLSNTRRVMHCTIKNGISFTVPGEFNSLGRLEFSNRDDSIIVPVVLSKTNKSNVM